VVNKAQQAAFEHQDVRSALISGVGGLRHSLEIRRKLDLLGVRP
jgi:hypothetical protein